MTHKLPVNLVLSRMSSQPKGSLQLIIDETAHLPKERDFTATLDTVKKAFKASDIDEQAIASQTRKLMTMSRNLLEDRKDLRPVLKEARGVLSEWNDWLEISEGGATEEELQERLEYLAAAMSHLREALGGYESGVLKKLTKE
jgi:small-conductance mechanosensitive channel